MAHGQIVALSCKRLGIIGCLALPKGDLIDQHIPGPIDERLIHGIIHPYDIEAVLFRKGKYNLIPLLIFALPCQYGLFPARGLCLYRIVFILHCNLHSHIYYTLLLFTSILLGSFILPWSPWEYHIQKRLNFILF